MILKTALRQGVLFTRFIETKVLRGLRPLLLKEFLAMKERIGGPQERVRHRTRVGLSAISMREKRSGVASTSDGAKMVRGATRYYSLQVVNRCSVPAERPPDCRRLLAPSGDAEAIHRRSEIDRPGGL